MNDRELNIRLAADASDLKRAQAEGAAGFEKLGAAGQQASQQMSAADQANAAVAKANRDARRAEAEAYHKARVEANNLAQANKQLAMNMTDVTVGLATGQPAWMIAIQQGGQIRDAYGGIVPAGRAVLGMLTPLTVGFGLSAAAAGAAAMAYSQGAAEMQAYGRALAMTNNSSGTTRNELAGLAREMNTLTVTQGQAAAALAATAATGAVQSQNLRLVADAAINLQRVGGPAVVDTVAKFAELGRAPVQASEKLNAELHYLTATVYDQIRALEKQGKVAEAGALAQAEYAKAVKRQTQEIEQQLGSLERAWKGAGEMAAWAWDKMLGLGRPRTPQEELALLEKQLAQPIRRGGNELEAQRRRDAAELRRGELRAQIYMEGEAAAAQQAAAEAADKHIREAAQREAEAKALVAARVQAAKDALQVEVAAYAQAGELLQAYHSANLLTEQSYFAGRRALIEATARVQIDALKAENAALASQTLYGAEAISRDSAVASNRRKMAAISAKAAADVGLANVQERLSLEALNRAQVEYEMGLDRVNKQRGLADQRTVAGLRLGDAARDRAARQASILDRYNSDVDQAKSDRFNGRIGQAQYEERLALLRTYYDQALQQEADYQEKRAEVERSGTAGFQRAMANYAESAANKARQTEQLWSNAFNSMEDAVVRFAMTGKLSFKDMANSIVADLIRIYVRQQLVGMLGSLFGNPVAGGTGFGDYNSSAELAQVRHGGGVIGQDAPAASRWMPAGTWDHAPRFHSGRLASDEVAAILQKDESVLTPAQMRQLGPAGGSQIALNLTVVNQTGQAVDAKARRTDDGGIEVLLSAAQSAMAGDVSQGRGEMYVALKNRFALRD